MYICVCASEAALAFDSLLFKAAASRFAGARPELKVWILPAGQAREEQQIMKITKNTNSRQTITNML